jgi:hypothetical protein
MRAGSSRELLSIRLLTAARPERELRGATETTTTFSLVTTHFAELSRQFIAAEETPLTDHELVGAREDIAMEYSDGVCRIKDLRLFRTPGRGAC